MDKRKALLSAALASLIATAGIVKASTAHADDNAPATAEKADKDGCKGKEGCEHKGKCKGHGKKKMHNKSKAKADAHEEGAAGGETKAE